MSTCKTALRIIWAHKFYFLVYLVGMSAIMIIAGSANMQSAVQAESSSSVGRFEPAQANIAVINRDRGSQAGRELGQGLEKYLQKSSALVSVDDNPRALQDANISGKSDLLIIIPAGYGQQFIGNLNETIQHTRTATLPKVETTASFNSSRGSLAQLQVDAYFDAVRTASLTGLTAGGPSRQPPDTAAATVGPATLKRAAAYAVSHYDSNQPGIKVHANPKRKDRQLGSGFAVTLGLASYPLTMALTVCVAVLFAAFNSPDRHRRILTSPLPTSSLNRQELLAGLILALISWAYYVAVIAASMQSVGAPLASFGWGRVSLGFAAMLLFTCTAAAFGFMLAQFNPTPSVINTIGIIFGLVIMFTSGASGAGALPPAMRIIGKLTPGWWYNSAVTAIMGVPSPGQSLPARPDRVNSWLPSLVLLVLFALAYVCIGLAVSRLTRTRSSLVSATSSDPTMVG
ncbi:ABC transporter permease [Bifidobacterium xylocopae]|uniref:ABC-2 type transporter transmembrane domain-containing protein n=1 Tax=Bifidobacterium xylocopae TaxID=2493119 RepID=A0A366KGB3_9BIFI|nr:ABC transporter permease [Bifidobacterium xylocopae]RBP99731.1 hypothetical protein CRD59_01395 [Bifidobacterium xylocopae]